MKPLLIAFLTAWTSAIAVLAADKTVPARAPAVATNAVSAEEKELNGIMEKDDATLDEIDQWIRVNNARVSQGSAEAPEELNKRIHARLDAIRKNYDDFLHRHPRNADGHLAYGTFLNDIGDEELAVAEFEAAKKYDPANPAAWNNLANYYGEHGPTTNAFVYYGKAITLDSNEPVYYRNLATLVFLFRKDASEFYGIDETHVFDKSLALYQKAIQLDPTNFDLATDYADSYYGIKPLRTNDALASWTNALKIASSEVEREGVLIHLARVKLVAGRYAEVQGHLDGVTNIIYEKLKSRLQRNLDAKLHPELETNTVATNAVVSTNSIGITNIVAATNSAPSGK